MIILQDGVVYKLWKPKREVQDFEPMIKHHVRDIFGEGSEYFPKKKLTSLAKTRSIPDGFVVDFQRKKWYIIELKILCDDAIRRISGQIVDYKNAIKNQVTRRKIYKAIRLIKNVDLLDDLINDENPEIIVIIDNLDGELGEKFKEKVKGTESKVKIIEFQTYARDYVQKSKVHIHLFEPLYDEKNSPQSHPPKSISPFPTLNEEKTVRKVLGKENANGSLNIIREIENGVIIPIGQKGKQILMVLKKMNEGKNYQIAVREVANELNITYNAVADKCGRQLTGSSRDFVEMVKNKSIYDYLYKKGVIRKTS